MKLYSLSTGNASSMVYCRHFPRTNKLTLCTPYFNRDENVGPTNSPRTNEEKSWRADSIHTAVANDVLPTETRPMPTFTSLEPAPIRMNFVADFSRAFADSADRSSRYVGCQHFLYIMLSDILYLLWQPTYLQMFQMFPCWKQVFCCARMTGRV